MKQLLKPGAIPTIFPRPPGASPNGNAASAVSTRHSTAYEKRERARVCESGII